LRSDPSAKPTQPDLSPLQQQLDCKSLALVSIARRECRDSILRKLYRCKSVGPADPMNGIIIGVMPCLLQLYEGVAASAYAWREAEIAQLTAGASSEAVIEGSVGLRPSAIDPARSGADQESAPLRATAWNRA